ncbi:MAG: MoaD/ThiS family protein [Rhodopirellula sp.]|nr:MoaD/ThiS family protein [Rhodopirellula sp.]
MNVRVVFSGRNYHWGSSLPEQIALSDSTTVDEAIRVLESGLPDGQRLPGSCLLAVSGVHLGTIARHPSRELQDGDELLLIAPVAGG